MSVLLIAGVIVLIGLAIPIAVSDIDRQDHYPFRTAMIATIQVIALATAIFPKRRYGFANEDIYGRTPWAFILGAGVCAVVLAVLVGLGFRTLAFEKWNAALDDFLNSLPWLLMAFSTAAACAFLIQDSRWALASSPRARRMKDAAAMAASMIITLSIVLVLFHFIPYFSRDMVESLLQRKFMIMPVTGIIGFLIGYLVPFQFREQGTAKRKVGQVDKIS
jgi:hypothetical protein